MKLSVTQAEYSRKGGLPSPVWWSAYLAVAIWAQELTGGLDFFSPGLLICLQSGRYWTAAWIAALWVLVQEGVGSLVFGVVILFYAGMIAMFLLSRWLLEPGNPLFILLFSLVLAVWSWAALHGAISFQELPAQMHAPWPWIAKQWAAYAIFWGVALPLYERGSSYGRV